MQQKRSVCRYCNYAVLGMRLRICNCIREVCITKATKEGRHKNNKTSNISDTGEATKKRLVFRRLISLSATYLNTMGTFTPPYKIEKSMYFILTPNIKTHINSHKPYGCIKIWLRKS